MSTVFNILKLHNNLFLITMYNKISYISSYAKHRYSFQGTTSQSISLRNSTAKERIAKLKLLLKNFLEMEDEVLAALSKDLESLEPKHFLQRFMA